jgi:hypothetical protein
VISLASHTVGNALVVFPEERMTEEAKALAMSVAADAEHEMVVVDLPDGVPVSAWDTVAELLPRRRRGVRLVLGGRSREAVALTGQWLSERLGRTVVAPDGAIFRGTGGTLFVHSGKGSGWIRFRPGRAPEWEAKRFPRPLWDSGAVDPWPTSSVCIADPIPGGAWIHSAARDSATGQHWSRLVRGMPCQPEVLTVVLGCPGTPPVSLDDVSRFWRRLDDQVRERLRFVQYGPVRVPEGATLGQALADLLDDRVVCYAGMPVGSTTIPDIYTVCGDGGLGWQAFAREIGYLPRTHPTCQETPALLTHRMPVAGLEQIEPTVYWYTPDAVVEVVQSGLWMRPPENAQNAEAVRAQPWNVDTSVLAFDASDEKRAERMRVLARDLLARLDPATRVRTRLVPASEMGREAVRVAGPAAGELRAESVADTVRMPPARFESSVPAATTAQFDAPTRAVTAPSFAASAPAAAAAPIEPPVSVAAPVATAAPVETDAPVRADSGTASDVMPRTPPKPPAAPEKPAQFEAGPVSAMSIRLECSPVPGIDEPVAPSLPDPAPASEPQSPVTSETPRAPENPPAPGPKPTTDREQAPEVPAEQAETRTVATETPAGPRLQPTPRPAASALVSGHELTEERGWLRRTLSREFDTMAHSISRILSEHPGFQGTDSRSSADVLTDTVAVRLYLSEHGGTIDQALRAAGNGPHVPFARCVVAGLTRMPSHRGATIFAASPTPEEWQLYQRRRLITDWSFIHALTEPSADQQGDVDVLLWSMTARRTKLLESAAADQVDNRVVFVPGTSFKLLEMTEPGADGTRGRLLLRELAQSEVDEKGRVNAREALDELAINSLRQCTGRWAAAQPRGAVGESARSRFGALPGLV